MTRLVAAGARGGRLKPLPAALALMLVSGGVAMPASAQQAFSSGWFAAKNAAQTQAITTGRLPNGAPVSSLTGARQSQAAREQLQRSVGNLGTTAAAIAAQQAAQRAVRDAALASGAPVPDGMVEGGLKVDANPLTAGWRNARAPVTTVEDGRTKVAIEQTGSKAVLNWETFNVGKRTTVEFQQDSTWAVLNRVNDPQARPSVIQGQIKAAGTVMVVNRNGVVFDGTSQVNVRNLVAAAARITDTQFENNGLYGPDDKTPTFTDALGKVELRPGALIETNRPATVTQSGGYVLLVGREVDNAGTLTTARGQAALVAGDSFIIKRGQGTEGNAASTTRGNEITPTGEGVVTNRGLILSPQGDITLAARTVDQAGVLAASTSVDSRGTIHLNGVGAKAAVTLRSGAVSAILVDTDNATALDGQRDNLMPPSVDTTGTLAQTDRNRRELSLVQIDSGGTVDFQRDSLTLATGGQIAVKAAGRSLVRDGAQLDVAGAIGVAVSMESNNLKINLQGNEQRDSPLNRDDARLNNSDVWLDRRSLIRVAGGTGGYEGDRWYSGGGLLEVGGYLGTLAVPASHWLAQGGQVRFEGAEVVTQAGSTINLSGGTLDVQAGTLQQTWLRGQDGRLYTADRAPADLLYTGIYNGFEQRSERWGEKATRRFYNALLAPRTRQEDGYTVGRDAGALVISTRNAVLEGDLVSNTYQGVRQDRAPQAGLDGYSQSQRAVARGAALVVGNDLRYYDPVARQVHYQLGATADTVAEVIVGAGGQRLADGLDLAAALPKENLGKLFLDADRLNGFSLGRVRIAAGRSITVDSALHSADGGEITLYAPEVDIKANLVSRGGLIQAGNILLQPSFLAPRIEDTGLAPQANQKPGVHVASGVMLDARGVWANLLRDAESLAGLPVRDGGRVALRSSGDVTLDAGSVLDVSAGASVLADGKLQGGQGGSVTLAAYALSSVAATGGQLSMNGDVRGYGVTGGGTLSVSSGGHIVLGGPLDPQEKGTLRLDASLFRTGFGKYEINGYEGLTVADGAQIDVAMPVLRLPGSTAQAPGSGVEPGDVLSLWTPPLYTEDPLRGRLTQRVGADLALYSDRGAVGGPIVVGEGARVSVDPGRTIQIKGADQLTVLGRLDAWGGRIAINEPRIGEQPYVPKANPRSVWIGEQAVLDVAGRSYVAVDRKGQRYGVVQAGGSIEIGGKIDWETDVDTLNRPIDRHIILRPGSLLDASGTQAVLDLPGRGATVVGSDGGTIVLSSANGLHLDGMLRAAAGSRQAAGGTLGVSLAGAFYMRNQSPELAVQAERQLILAQRQGESLLAADLKPGQANPALVYGYGRLGVDRIEAGGFDNLALNADVHADGDVSLALRQSLRLSGALSLQETAPAASVVNLSASYVLFNQARYRPLDGADAFLQPVAAPLKYLHVDHRLNVAADLLDVRGMRNLVTFDDVRFDVLGDMRLGALGFGDRGLMNKLAAPGRLTLTAAQIYPVTGPGSGGIIAVGDYLAKGPNGDIASYNHDAVLTLRRTDGQTPAMPYSAFGAITLAAPLIEQGGVLRAPLGAITFESRSEKPSTVRFLPGSITSISGGGLLMPYGGTVDGVKYTYAGRDVTPDPTRSDDYLGRKIQIQGSVIEVAEGAVLDLSGGGELTGGAFVRGRGGSVDVLRYAMADANPGFSFSRSGNAVYAIVPGFTGSQAPVAADAGAGNPAVGRQVTIQAGVPGLPAGTYTLLPSTYALLPGAFRVELGPQGANEASVTAATRGGSWVGSGLLGTARTGQLAALPTRLLITPADVVRRHAQYNETSYNAFVLADAARKGIARGMLTTDARALHLNLAQGAGMGDVPALSFKGTARFDVPAGSGSYAGRLAVTGPADGLEILAAGQTPVLNPKAAAIYAADLNALSPGSMFIGGTVGGQYASGARSVGGNVKQVVVRSGAALRAPEIFLYSLDGGRGILVEQGATLSTLGRGDVAQDARTGLYYDLISGAMLAVSNGLVNLLVPKYGSGTAIDVGGCLTDCAGPARLLSEGSIGASTSGAFTWRDTVQYGTRNLALSVSAVNLGSAQALQQAGAAGRLPPGLALNQDVLGNLLRGNTALEAPALESLILNAGESVNVYGSVSLDARGAGGRSLQRLVLGAPAIYGYGAAGDTATIAAAEFVWAGATAADRGGSSGAGANKPQAPGGAILDSLGSGALNIAADVIRLESSPYRLPNDLVPAERLVLGFSSVTLDAAQMISSRAKGGLSVYHAPDGYTAQDGWRYRDGDLLIRTPLLTGEAGSVNSIKAGGALAVTGTGGAAAARNALGATLNLAGRSVLVDTTVALPSGKLTVKADGDITLGAGSRLDMSGREVRLLDQMRYSWGGDIDLQSTAGNITQARGGLIDVSAVHNRAGRIQAVALGEGAGRLDLAGSFRGTASGLYDAGGTRVAYESAEAVLRAQTVADFADLNARLTEGGVFGARSFQIKRGDLVVGDEVRARQVELVLDGGSLTVNGRIDASGAQVGSIRLAAMRDLVINGLLDTHGTGLRVDSYGKIIDSVNRAIVDLTSREGTLVLGAGAAVDLRAGTDAPNNDGVARGTLDLNARRLGGGNGQGAFAGSGDGANDVAVTVLGTPAILGAKTVAVNAFRRYNDAPLASAPDVTGKVPQLISQAYLDGIDVQSQAFMTAALGNPALSARLAGLGNYHLRPGVEVVSATPDGDLSVVGDIDLSNYRYGPNVDRITPARRGYGEPGALVLRAGGNLNIYGSINDGFAPPPDSPDDAAGWQLVEGRYGSQAVTPFGGDLVVPIGGVKLEAGTSFPEGRTLNYDLPARPATLPMGTVLPVAMTLNAALSLPAGLVLTGDVTTASGSVLRAGTVLAGEVKLDAGSMLGAGFVLRSSASMRAFTWPKGVALPTELVASTRIVLAQGSLIPSQTKVVLLDGKPVDLRPKGPDGKQGRNWALAPMLGPGASAWSLTAVAGADLDSADVHARNVLGKGDLVLADTHYGLAARATQTTKTIFVGVMVLTPAGAEELFGDPLLVGKPIKELAEQWGFEWEEMCGWGDYCTPAPRTVSETGSMNWWGDLSWVGKPVEQLVAQLGITVDEFCADATNCLGGGTSETIVTREYKYGFGSPAFSVLRTGTGDLSLLAGRDVGMTSLYGVYTAGTQSSLGAADARFNLPRGADKTTGTLGLIQLDGKYDAALSVYQAWYPDQGGNLVVQAGRDVYGDAVGSTADAGVPLEGSSPRARYANTLTGAWLWRQGSLGTPGVADIAPSWWINFGSYATKASVGGGYEEPRLLGFTGFGTLGGGNLSISAGRDAGIRDARGDAARYVNGVEPRSQGLTAVVGSTGRVLDGNMVLTGGGDLDLRVGGSINPSLAATQLNATGPHTGGSDHLDLNGVLANLRGRLAVSAGQMGGMDLNYGDGGGLRAADPYAVAGGRPMGGPRLVLGDAVAWIDTRSDLVLGGVSDPGRARPVNASPYQRVGDAQPTTGGGESWFTLWTPSTAVNLFSAGGNLTPMTVTNARFSGDELRPEITQIDGTGRRYFVYPSILRAVAANGNIVLASNATGENNPVLLLAPSAGGQLEMLAGRSILATDAHTVSMSAADVALPTPLRPAFSAYSTDMYATLILTNTSTQGVMQASGWDNKPLFVFGPGTPLDRSLHAGDASVARFYAASGDIVGVKSGAVVRFNGGGGVVRSVDTWYEAALPVSVRAGRDILGLDVTALHSNARDFSLIEAGRDIVYANAQVAGPGTLLMQAGRQLRQEDVASVRSLGAIVRGDTRPGADLAVLAGVGSAGPDYASFLARYLDGARGLQAGEALGTHPGKVVQAYGGEMTLRGWLAAEFGYAGDDAGAPAELARQQALRDADTNKARRDLKNDFEQDSGVYLVNWLRKHHGYQGDEAGAGAALAALAPAELGIYARQLFFAELKEGGREYNDDGGPRFGSYLRGRRAIAALFPDVDAAGTPLRYDGSFTMYGGAGLRSNFGGNIQLLTPGGRQVLGVEGVAPPASAGVVTQGQGNIQLYAQGSLLLGQSRIMTTFGGHIQAWSAEGDINAGRGAKTTVLYTPPRRVYDAFGNVTLSPTVPSTGAGIGTLAPIPEVPAGDVDLIAPLGTIDAGEAGIRVSGNVNVAALHVVNAANIQVQGDSKGIPVTVSVNTNALTSASAAATSASSAAQDVMQRDRAAARQNQPSIFNVQILGFGTEQLPAGSGAEAPPPKPPAPSASYDPGSAVRVLGLGELPQEAQQQLTEREQSNLGRL